MDQGNITTFKAYYVRKISQQAIVTTTDDDAISITEL
jgi:hypothetical protein